MAGRMEKIVTYFWRKPIPTDEFDWSAHRDNDEPSDDGQMAMGYGSTETEAVLDLYETVGEPEDTYWRVVACAACGTEGQLISWSGSMDQYGNPIERTEPCPYCEGTGGEVIKTQPIDMEEAGNA